MRSRAPAGGSCRGGLADCVCTKWESRTMVPVALFGRPKAANAGRRPQQGKERVIATVKPPYYPFDVDRAEEQRRLVVLGGLSERNTERVFREAGLGPGMRVLDLGSGAGDVASLVARLVGEHGSVVGVEQSAQAVASAQRRIAQAGYN